MKDTTASTGASGDPYILKGGCIMKHLTNTELSLLAQEMITCMRDKHDDELSEYADQYAERLGDIRIHGMNYENDAQVQEELHDDYIELIIDIRKALANYYKHSNMEVII